MNDQTGSSFPLPGAEDPPPEPVVDPAPETASDREGNRGKGSKRAKMAGARLRERAADEALTILDARFEVFRQPDGTAFIVDRRTGVATDFGMGVSQVGRILSSVVFETCGAVLKSAEKADLFEHLAAQAYSGSNHAEMHLRSGPHAGGVVIDLAEPESARAIEVMPSGWRVVDRSPLFMRRTRRTGALPVPERGGDVADLRRLLGWSPETSDVDFQRLIAWMLAAMLRVGDVPVLLLRGGQGTGKSRAARMVLALVDPCTDDGLVSPPRDEDQLVISAGASWVMAWDNLSRISEWLSDALCRAVTGGSFIRRRLYSDADTVPISVRRAIILTSIGTDALRGDLAERVVLVEPPPIGQAARRDENELDAAFERIRPRLLGALLDLASRVLAALPLVKPPKLHRMAAYSRLCFAVDGLLGWSTYADLVGGNSALALETVEGDAVAQAILSLLKEEHPMVFAGGCTDLLKRLDKWRPESDRRWPENAAALGTRLRRLVGPMLEQGVEMSDSRTNAGRRWRIERRAVAPAD